MNEDRQLLGPTSVGILNARAAGSSRPACSDLRSCPDCGVAAGEAHEDNCDVERCSACGGQLLMCGCDNHDKAFARWTGFWPGSLEADALGIDLNTLYRRGLNRTFFVKPTDGQNH